MRSLIRAIERRLIDGDRFRLPPQQRGRAVEMVGAVVPWPMEGKGSQAEGKQRGHDLPQSGRASPFPSPKAAASRFTDADRFDFPPW